MIQCKFDFDETRFKNKTKIFVSVVAFVCFFIFSVFFNNHFKMLEMFASGSAQFKVYIGNTRNMALSVTKNNCIITGDYLLEVVVIFKAAKSSGVALRRPPGCSGHLLLVDEHGLQVVPACKITDAVSSWQTVLAISHTGPNCEPCSSRRRLQVQCRKRSWARWFRNYLGRVEIALVDGQPRADQIDKHDFGASKIVWHWRWRRRLPRLSPLPRTSVTQ